MGQRHVLGTFFHIGLFALGKVLQEPDHTSEPPLGNPAQTNRRPAVSVLYPTFVECPEGRDLVGRVLFYRVLGRRYRRSLVELGGAGLVREVLQHRALRTLQELKSSAGYPMLEFGVIGLAHGIAVGEGHEQRPGWFDLFRMLFDQSDDDSWQSGLFEHPGDHIHGVGAKGSNRHQQDQINVLGMHGFRRLRTGFLDDLSGVALGAHGP